MLRDRLGTRPGAIALRDEDLLPQAVLTGVDLVDAFAPRPPGLAAPQLVASPVSTWTPSRSFDLITCVHGLHYIGDKLVILTRAASWLTRDGVLIADLDLAGIQVAGQPATRRLARALRDAGFCYDSRRHRISRTGRLEATLPYRYLGADDRAGPNYAGQPAVISHYERKLGASTATARSCPPRRYHLTHYLNNPLRHHLPPTSRPADYGSGWPVDYRTSSHLHKRLPAHSFADSLTTYSTRSGLRAAIVMRASFRVFERETG